jgi:hypothetical protein
VTAAMSGLVAATPRSLLTGIGADPELATIQSRHDGGVGCDEPEAARSDAAWRRRRCRRRIWVVVTWMPGGCGATGIRVGEWGVEE